ncbi:MAG: hypothetical protein AB1941_19125 [Gemmatimonadota bacterium]
MGIAKWLARRGAVGGTARWAANGYKFFRQRHPDPQDFSDSQVFRLMIVTRYETLPNAHAERSLLQLADQVLGLRGLVAAILSVEAGFTENTPEAQAMFLDVIAEELENAGLAEQAIYGAKG